MSEAYSLPMNAKPLVGSVMANLSGSHYPLDKSMVEASTQRVIIDKDFSVPKCVRLIRKSHHSHQLLRRYKSKELLHQLLRRYKSTRDVPDP